MRHKIYPDLSLIVIKDTRIQSKTHFVDLINGIQSDELFDEHYHFLYDGRAIDWKNSDADDINDAITIMQNTRSIDVHCIYIIQNIGQMAYADIFFISTSKYLVEYFQDPAEACAFLDVPISILDH